MCSLQCKDEGTELMGIPHTREPQWKFIMTRLFGKHMISIDHVHGEHIFVCEGYNWNGRLYITKYHALQDPATRRDSRPG